MFILIVTNVILIIPSALAYAPAMTMSPQKPQFFCILETDFTARGTQNRQPKDYRPFQKYAR